MNRFAIIILLIACLILSLVNSSGLGRALDTPEYTGYGIILLAFLTLFSKRVAVIKISSNLRFGLVSTLAVAPYIISETTDGINYFCALLLVYVISTYKITPKIIKPVCLAYGGFGLAILLIYSRMDILRGWNDNAISMLGLFSFLFFSIYLLLLRTRKAFIVWNGVTVMYLSMLFATDCRSGMVFSVIAIVCILFRTKAREILSNKKIDFLIINIPLIISGIVIWVASTDFFPQLNLWSIVKYNKPIFNGREELWQVAYKMLAKSYYLGTGEFKINYHNSGVAAISVFGILGYICWSGYFITLLRQLRYYLRDVIVFGAVMCFCLIFLQQTVDLGFISSSPNMIPYVALGVACGRANTIASR